MLPMIGGVDRSPCLAKTILNVFKHTAFIRDFYNELSYIDQENYLKIHSCD
jgi:hypothetical protein